MFVHIHTYVYNTVVRGEHRFEERISPSPLFRLDHHGRMMANRNMHDMIPPPAQGYTFTEILIIQASKIEARCTTSNNLSI